MDRDYMGSIASYLESIEEDAKAIDFYNEAINRLIPKFKKN
jgi:hypothetical protein